MCQDCAFEPYCGADPTYHHATQGDYLGRKPHSGFHRRNMAIFELLLDRYEGDPATRALFSDLGGPLIALRGKAGAHRLAEPLSRAVWRAGRRADALAAAAPSGPSSPISATACPRASSSTSLRATASDPGRRRDRGLPAARARLPRAAATSSRSAPTAQRIRVLWRHRAPQNSILLTERCDHYCLMCSQPPKSATTTAARRGLRADPRCCPARRAEIGFTGGEPTLYGERLLDLLRLCRNLHPEAAGPRALQRHRLRRSRRSPPPGPGSTTRT